MQVIILPTYTIANLIKISDYNIKLFANNLYNRLNNALKY